MLTSNAAGVPHLAGWPYRKPLSIDHTLVPSNQTNIPIWVDLSGDADVTTKARTDATDVVFTTDDGQTTMPHELISTRKFLTGDGAWCWFAEPRAVYYNGKTYAGWVDQAGNIKIAEYVHATATWSTPFTLHTALQYDDHANPSILIRDSDKKLIVFYSAHNGANLYMRISTNTEDATAWDAEVDLDTAVGFAGYSYPVPFQLLDEANDPIWLFFRYTDVGGKPWGYTKSTDGGATWAAGTKLWDNSEQVYMKAVQASGTRIDFTASNNNPATTAASLYHFYYDGGTWYTSAGVDMGAPDFGPGDATLVYDGSTSAGWMYDIAINASGNPVIIFDKIVTAASNHRYRYAAWSGTAWSDAEICAGGAPLLADNGYGGGACIDHENTNIVYVSAVAGTSHEILQYTTADAGATWALTSRITSDSPLPNYRPICPRNHAATLPLLWCFGYYPAYDAFQTNLCYATGTTGTFLFVVAAPTLSSTANTRIYANYGNSSAAAQSSRATTWSTAGYVAVFHHSVENSATSVASYSVGAPIEATGGLYRYQQMNRATPDYVISTLNSAGWSGFTAELWAQYDSSGADEHTLVSNLLATGGSFILRLEPSNDTVEANAVCGTNTVIGGSYLDLVVTPNVFGWLVLRYDTTNGLQAALNDTWSATVYGAGSGNLDADASNPWRIGSSAHTIADHLTGKVYEVRVSNARKADDWLTTIYNNQVNPALFYTVGSEE
jgi:hypothetical protein